LTARWRSQKIRLRCVFALLTPLTCVSYVAAPLRQAFVNLVAVGDKLPDLSVISHGG
jgi:hypothetical protein